MLSNYILGVLYGDGYLQYDDMYFFSTTHKEIADRVKEWLDYLGIRYISYTRDYQNPEYENWELLEIMEIRDIEFIDYLDRQKFFSDNAYDRIKNDVDFIRGYLETKGTFFKYFSRENEVWRCAFSGSYDDVYVIKEILKSWGIESNQMIQRNDRRDKGIESESYRFSIQRRNMIALLVDYLYGERDDIEISLYLKEKFDEFLSYHRSTPFNRKREIFKHYRNASLYMARELGLEVKGIRGGGGMKGYKPVYLWENGEPVKEFMGWQGVYEWLVDVYESETGYSAPLVEEE